MGIAHLDLKPSNVVIVEGQAKLIDFGSAHYSGASLNLQKVGTTAYLPPEAFEGSVSNLEAVDLYALGLILYQILFNKLPYKGDFVYQAIANYDVIKDPLV